MLSNKSKEIDKLQKVIGYKFNNPEIFITALTHKSCCVETEKNIESNGRLEFLGDSVLSAVAAHYLYLKYPGEDEGNLSKLKSQIVSSSNLSFWANELSLGNYAFLGKGENNKISRQRKNLLCDLFEAVVGAIYLDGGYKQAEIFIINFLISHKKISIPNFKSQLQEKIQLNCRRLPEYKTIKESGEDHSKRFEVAVFVENRLLGVGVASSKKEAQQKAAEQAIKNIEILDKI
jgi:ribonuclease-3